MELAKKLMCIFAHPDDETLGMGPAIAKYAAEGVQVSLICATRGQRGWFSGPDSYPGMDALGRIREKELLSAAQKLGITRVDLFDAMDGELAQTDPASLITRIVPILREVQPQVVVSFGPDGHYCHPDHIAISQMTSAAILCAADPQYQPKSGPAHRVSKFYYMVAGEKVAQAYQKHGVNIELAVNGSTRTTVAWPEWAITTRIQARDYLPQVVEAILCHQTQLPSLPGIEKMPLNAMEEIFGELTFYRAMSLVDGFDTRENDLFQGIK
jgi:LmbE family N-acetylglucosaminyl deacetylase